MYNLENLSSPRDWDILSSFSSSYLSIFLRKDCLLDLTEALVTVPNRHEFTFGRFSYKDESKEGSFTVNSLSMTKGSSVLSFAILMGAVGKKLDYCM